VEHVLEGRGNRFLGGTPEDGFHGILRCPSAGRGNPDVDAIGHALAVLARGYRRNPDRSLIFDDLLDQVTALSPPDWPGCCWRPPTVTVAFWAARVCRPSPNGEKEPDTKR